MPKVHLTAFICRELVYDYLTGKLDGQRRQAFQDFLQEDRDLQRKLDRAKHGLRYVGELKKVELSEELLRYLSEKHNFDFALPPAAEVMPKLIAKNEAKKSRSWSFSLPLPSYPWLRRGGEALLLASLVFVVVSYLPQGLFDLQQSSTDKAIILGDEASLRDSSLALQNPNSTPQNFLSRPKSSSASETTDENALVAILSSDSAAKLEATPETMDKALSKASAKASTQGAVPVSKPVTTAAVAKADPTGVTKTELEDEAPVTQKFYLYRSIVYVADMDGAAESLLKYLEKVGATKAGQVKLGWEKDRSRYFHFHMDEKNKEPMLEVLRNFAPSIQLGRYDHWRKTPPGQIRAIVEIRQKVQ